MQREVALVGGEKPWDSQEATPKRRHPARGEQLASRTNRLQGDRQPVREVLGVFFTCRSKDRPVNY